MVCPRRLRMQSPRYWALVRCTCLSDGEMTRWNRDEFVGVLDEKFLPDWAKESLSQFQQEEAAESPGMNNQSM